MKKIAFFALTVIVLAFGFVGCDNGNGDEPKTYTVTIGTLTDANGSTITASPTSGAAGTEITLTVTENAKRMLKSGTLKYGTTAIDETSKKFILPAEDVVITATFEPAITLSGKIWLPARYDQAKFIFLRFRTQDDWEKNSGNIFPNGETSWSAKVPVQSVERTIHFYIYGHDKNNNNFAMGVPNLTTKIKDQDVTDIDINLKDVTVITISGTINISYGGNPVKSVDLQISTESWFLLGSVHIRNVGNGTTWSMDILPQATATKIISSIACFNTPDPWAGPMIFSSWGDKIDDVTIHNSNVSNITLDYGEMNK